MPDPFDEIRPGGCFFGFGIFRLEPALGLCGANEKKIKNLNKNKVR
jgi:hypothetical protein